MKFLGIGETNELGSLYLDLMKRGHTVKVFIEDKDAGDTLAGLVESTPDWRHELESIRAAGADGFILFETAKHGALQDELRREGFQVIGGSAFGDRLEAERGFAQEVLASVGMRTAPYDELHSFDEARALIRARHKRYVIKLNGLGYASSSTFVGQLDDGRDMIGYLAAIERRWKGKGPSSFILMEHIDGVETGIGAYFNGEKFIGPVCVDWEHKRFFPGDVGEMTGEMGTLVSYRGSDRIFSETLAKLAPALAEHSYCGYINLNTIINAEGIWPLELTCRFGYPGFAILQALHISPWEQLFRAVAQKRDIEFATHPGFAVGVVLTVPSFPLAQGYEENGKGMPILFREPWTKEDEAHVHYSEVARVDDELVTSGMIGYIMVVTGRGDTVAQARDEAYRRVANVCIPNMRYRNDIGSRFESRERALLERWGWLDAR